MPDELVSPCPNGYDCVMATKKPAPPHGGFRKIELGSDVAFRKKVAEEKIINAYRGAGANLHKAAGILGVTERTLHRYVDTLCLREKLKKITGEAMRGGWLDAKRRPKKAA